MRLRKIELGNPHKPLDGCLFFPSCRTINCYLPNALGMYVDKVTPAEEQAVIEHFRRTHRFYSSAVRNMPRGDINSHLFADYSLVVADAEDMTMNNLGAQNRNALLVVTPTIFSGIHHTPYVEVGEYRGQFMEVPVIRGGVPPFEGINAYLEIANGQEPGRWDNSDPALRVLEKVITEFETFVHEQIFREILAGTRKKFTGSALYEHLHQTGQTSKW